MYRSKYVLQPIKGKVLKPKFKRHHQVQKPLPYNNIIRQLFSKKVHLHIAKVLIWKASLKAHKQPIIEFEKESQIFLHFNWDHLNVFGPKRTNEIGPKWRVFPILSVNDPPISHFLYNPPLLFFIVKFTQHFCPTLSCNLVKIKVSSQTRSMILLMLTCKI